MSGSSTVSSASKSPPREAGEKGGDHFPLPGEIGVGDRGCALHPAALQPCVDAGSRYAKKAGETDERLFAVAAWRETPYFTDAECSALALTEAATRLSDRADPVPDEIWNEAVRYYDEPALA
jgi:hypothetical protein